jgi:hypothetical protein
VSDVVIDTDLRMKQDGTPYSQQRTPEDPGVVVRFRRHGRPYAIPCDRFVSIEANLRAVALMLEASRLLERYGFDQFTEEFEGYKALPDGTASTTVVDPHIVLGVQPGAAPEVVAAAFKALALKHHPDRGGDADRFKQLVEARDRMLREATA